MKTRKHYENDSIIVYAHEEGDTPLDMALTFANEQQMQRLGRCLADLARIGGNEVTIGEPTQAPASDRNKRIKPIAFRGC